MSIITTHPAPGPTSSEVTTAAMLIDSALDGPGLDGRAQTLLAAAYFLLTPDSAPPTHLPPTLPAGAARVVQDDARAPRTVAGQAYPLTEMEHRVVTFLAANVDADRMYLDGKRSLERGVHSSGELLERALAELTYRADDRPALLECTKGARGRLLYRLLVPVPVPAAPTPDVGGPTSAETLRGDQGDGADEALLPLPSTR